jgi:hypothetical protein
MPSYKIGDDTFRRKNLYMPCAIAADIESMSQEEQVAVYKATYWADLFTNAEWPVVLKHEGVKSYVRSRLKKKVVGWWMAMGRLAYLHPTFYNETVAAAKELYREQIGEEHPCFAHTPPREDPA